MKAAIIAAAQRRAMTWYSEIAGLVTATHLDPHSALMNHLLGEVFREEHVAGRPALTAIVTHKSGDLEPGTGFYDQARSLGIKVGVPFEFWSQQVQEVFTRYGEQRPPRRPPR